MAIELKPPSSIPASGRCMFLAGSIDMGLAEDWQSKLRDAFEEDRDLVLLNPRHDGWDPSWEQSIENSVFRQQVTWELDGLDRADVIAMYLAPGSKSPISLLELGLHARERKLVVLCPEGFWRRGNVQMMCARFGLELHTTWDSWVDALRGRVATSSRVIE